MTLSLMGNDSKIPRCCCCTAIGCDFTALIMGNEVQTALRQQSLGDKSPSSHIESPVPRVSEVIALGCDNRQRSHRNGSLRVGTWPTPVRQSPGPLLMHQRFLTDDEIHSASAMMGRQFWFGPVVFSLGCLGTGWVAARYHGDPIGMWLFILFSTITTILWTLRLRQYKKFTADLEHRTAEMLEGAPQKVWVQRNTGDCYLQLSGHKIRVPNDCYGALKDATIVKVAFLPRSHFAVHVEIGRGIGLS